MGVRDKRLVARLLLYHAGALLVSVVAFAGSSPRFSSMSVSRKLADIRPPDESAAKVAAEAARALTPLLKARRAAASLVLLRSNDAQQEIVVPREALELLVRILEQMAAGNAVTVIPVHAELTTQEAADLLNVSRPYLVSLLDQGAIPFHMVGTHRRVRFQDLLDYKERDDARRRAVVDALTADAEELDLGYGRGKR